MNEFLIFFLVVEMSLYGFFTEGIAHDKSLRLFSDGTKCISLVFGGCGEVSSIGSFDQPLIVPPSTGGVSLPYRGTQLIQKSGYFSLRSCYLRFSYPALEENDAPYVGLNVVVYIGTRGVIDFALFRSRSYCYRGESFEVFVPDMDRLFVGANKNVFLQYGFFSVSGTTHKFSLDFRYCMTLDD